MKAPIAVSVAVGMVLGVAIVSAGQGAPAQAPAPQSHPTRVRVKLEGFDLARQTSRGGNTSAKHTGANQVGGASRGIGGVKLYAPEVALAYSLHPTFQWSGSADAKYNLHIEDIADNTSYDATVNGTSFTYPDDAIPLKPGSTYAWKVQPEVDIMGAASDPAMIVIAAGAQRDSIEDALAAIPQTGEENARARAQVFFDKRIWYDAAQDYSKLIAAHPGDRELHKSRGTLYDQVPATEKLADADFAAAYPK